MRPSPGLVLAALLVLLATQITRFVAPRRGPYAWTLLLSVAGLVIGELIAATGHFDGPSIGVVHPLADIAVVTIVQVLGLLLIGPGPVSDD